MKCNAKLTGERISALRKKQGLKQVELAKKLNVSRQIISYYETGARLPNTEYIAALAEILNTTTDFLIGLTSTASTDKDLKAVCDSTYIDMLNYIKSHVSKKELLAQLAEEATELAHAALKYRRALDDENPTPVSRNEAFKNLIEEIDDVALLLETLALKWRVEFNSSSREKKLKRWVERLKDARERVFEKP